MVEVDISYRINRISINDDDVVPSKLVNTGGLIDRMLFRKLDRPIAMYDSPPPLKGYKLEYINYPGEFCYDFDAHLPPQETAE